MAAPRSTSLRALRSLAQQQQHTPAPSSLVSRRSLHITGSKSAQPAAGTDILSIYRSRSLSDLKSECERRSLGSSGSKAELADRLANHDHLQTRAFSIAMRRIDGQAFGGNNTRAFNTSRSNKSRNDSSPVDLVYMPRTYTVTSPESPPRVPILPDAYTHYESQPTSYPTMKPQIYSVTDMGNDLNGPSPMAEVADNQALDINPFNLTETVSRSRSAAESATEVSASDESVGGAVKQVWHGFWEDMMGPNQSTGRSSKRG